MAQRIQLRRGTAAEWTAANPVLANGEPGVEKDTGKLKLGDGVTAWASLAYASQGEKGDQGDPGVADDASMAAIIADPTSEVAGELSATIVTATADKQTAPQVQAAITAAKPLIKVPDLVYSWWVYPQAWHVPEWDRTYFGGVSRNGVIKAAWVDHGANDAQTVVEIGKGTKDDHNAPWVRPMGVDRSVVYGHADHTINTFTNVRRSEYEGSAAFKAIQQIDFPNVATYGQMFYYAGTMYLFVRVGDVSTSWYWTSSTDFGATWGTPKQFLTGAGRNYMVIRPRPSSGDTSLELIAYGHPTDSTIRGIHAGFINLSNGEVRSFTPTATASTVLTNLFSGSAIDITAMQKIYTYPTGKSSRLFDVSMRGSSATSGGLQCILTCEWTEGVDTDSTYYYHERNTSTGAWTRTALGLTGAVIGYLTDKHYHGGACFADYPNPGGIVYICREVSGTWQVEKLTFTNATTYTTQVIYTAPAGRKLGRPVPVKNGKVGAKLMVNEYSRYEMGGFDDYMGAVVLLPG